MSLVPLGIDIFYPSMSDFGVANLPHIPHCLHIPLHMHTALRFKCKRHGNTRLFYTEINLAFHSSIYDFSGLLHGPDHRSFVQNPVRRRLGSVHPTHLLQADLERTHHRWYFRIDLVSSLSSKPSSLKCFLKNHRNGPAADEGTNSDLIPTRS